MRGRGSGLRLRVCGCAAQVRRPGVRAPGPGFSEWAALRGAVPLGPGFCRVRRSPGPWRSGPAVLRGAAPWMCRSRAGGSAGRGAAGRGARGCAAPSDAPLPGPAAPTAPCSASLSALAVSSEVVTRGGTLSGAGPFPGTGHAEGPGPGAGSVSSAAPLWALGPYGRCGVLGRWVGVGDGVCGDGASVGCRSPCEWRARGGRRVHGLVTVCGAARTARSDRGRGLRYGRRDRRTPGRWRGDAVVCGPGGDVVAGWVGAVAEGAGLVFAG